MKTFRDNPIIKFLLYPVLFLYKVVTLFRWLFYSVGLFRSYSVQSPVVSVGNIEMGGGGKTPFIIWLCDRLLSEGIKPVIITRGYGRRDEEEEIVIDPVQKWKPDPYDVGDEAAMLTRVLPDVPIICRADRVEAARTAIRIFTPDVILLDDGFQHLRLRRDLDIVVVPPTGSYWRREFSLAYRRAGILVYSGGYRPKLFVKGKPFFEAHRSMDDPVSIIGGRKLKFVGLAGKKAAAVAAIAQPKVFMQMLRERGLDLSLPGSLPDHYVYTDTYVRLFEELADNNRCEYIFTTLKDAVKLEALQIDRDKWYFAPLTLEISNSDEIMERIKSLI
jgi:tetraacyldisaccharide 4'-kinase